VEASSDTPFSGPALDRGLAGTLIALLRLGAPELTPPKAAMDFGEHRAELGEAAVQALVARALEHVSSKPGEELGEQVRLRARKLLDRWEEVIADAVASGAQRTYSGFDLGSSGRRRSYTRRSRSTRRARSRRRATSWRRRVCARWSLRCRFGGGGWVVGEVVVTSPIRSPGFWPDSAQRLTQQAFDARSAELGVGAQLGEHRLHLALAEAEVAQGGEDLGVRVDVRGAAGLP
jgi:hypothetical protein